VAVRPERERPPDTRIRRAARRQVGEADRTHRPGTGRQATGAPGTAGGQGHPVRPATAKRASFRCSGRRLPSQPIAATAVPAGAGVSGRLRAKTMTRQLVKVFFYQCPPPPITRRRRRSVI